MGFETSPFRAQLNDFPYLKRWLDQLAAHPAIIRVYEKGGSNQHHADRDQRIKKVSVWPGATRLAE